ncbi:hypothetical protein B0J11DRAFT_292864 [Dendryphion nanum]|uniref:Uncharacterized protein n=1 Tax=Dendryphion nanum TaxID=256645 RepID=A0A9P9DWI7_9PLEO|nr:hypothetical protein B0J11DRAFT_292864 [Dendryphion nanum]
MEFWAFLFLHTPSYSGLVNLHAQTAFAILGSAFCERLICTGDSPSAVPTLRSLLIIIIHNHTILRAGSPTQTRWRYLALTSPLVAQPGSVLQLVASHCFPDSMPSLTAAKKPAAGQCGSRFQPPHHLIFQSCLARP